MVLIFYDLDGFRHTLFGRLPGQIVVFFGDVVKLDDGQQLVFVVFENLGTEFVAVAVTHAITVDANFHLSLLCSLRRWTPRNG